MIPSDALAEIRAVFERCQRRYPTVRLPLEAFLGRVEQTVAASHGVSQSVVAWLETFALVHHEDLFLAVACALGDRIAWEHFADDFLPVLERLAARACRSPEDGKDLAQEIVAGLLTRDAGQVGSRLASYDGRGSLAGWLRVTVGRAAIDRFRRTRRERPLDDVEEELGERAPASGASPAAEVEARLDSRWGPVLAQLLEEELRKLTPRDRLLLALYYLHGVPLHAIGGRFGVHESTASRWLDELRRGIRKRVERELERRHGLRRRELESLWRAVSEGDLAPIGKALAE